MTRKEIKDYLLAQVKEEGYNIILFEYDEEYNTLRILKHKPNTIIIWKETYDIDENYHIHHRNTSLANFDS